MNSRYDSVDVAARFNVAPRTVQRWCRDHRITHIRTPGGAFRFTDAHLAEFEAANTRHSQRKVVIDAPNPTFRRVDVVVPMRKVAANG